MTPAIGRQELALDAIQEAGVDMLLAGHNHHASSHSASDLVTRAGGALVVQAGTATSTRVRDQEQSFNTIDVAEGSVTITVNAWKGDDSSRSMRSATHGRRAVGGCADGRARALSLARPRGRLERRMPLPEDFDLDDFVRRVLAEDLGSGGDVTSNATIPADARFTAEMNCRQAIVRRRPGHRRGFLPRARSRCRDRAAGAGRRSRRARHRR